MASMSSTNTNLENKSATNSGNNSGRSELNEAASHIREDLTSLKEDTHEAIGAASTCAKHGLDSALDIAKAGGSKAKDVHTSFEDRVKKHPTSAVLITLGAGVLLGRLVSRR